MQNFPGGLKLHGSSRRQDDSSRVTSEIFGQSETFTGTAMTERSLIRLIIFVLAISGTLRSGARVASAQESLECHVRGPVRVFYATEGEKAVNLTDADANGVPDRIEDVGKQVWAAHHLFCEVLDFPDPFKSERYKGVTCVEAYVRPFEKGNGLAFESAQRARKIPEGKPNDRTLVMRIGAHVVPSKNITPAHEFFHLIQYSTTYFKNPWYLEGMARWAEHSLAKEGVGPVKYDPRGPWPQSRQNLPKLVEMSYDAEFVLWNPIAAATDRRGSLSRTAVGSELANLRYSDGMPVLHDLEFIGAPVMREILLELGKMDDVAFKELGYDQWSEENQRSSKNAPYIYQAVMDVLRRRTKSVKAFRASPAR